MTTRSQQLQIRVTPAEKAALKRAASAAGQDLSAYVLARVLPAGHSRLAPILAALAEGGSRRFALAELNDVLTSLAPAEFGAATDPLDVATLRPELQNYVAAMVEQAARAKGVLPPAWVRDVAPLDEPHFATDLKRLRPYLLRVTPVAFKRRNLYADASVGARV